MIFLWKLICNSSCHIEIWEYTSRSVFSMFLSTRISWTFWSVVLLILYLFIFFPFFIFFFENRILDCTYIHVIVYGVDTKEDKLFCCSNVSLRKLKMITELSSPTIFIQHFEEILIPVFLGYSAAMTLP